MENTEETNKQILKDNFKQQARLQALQTAERLNPNERVQNNQLNTGLSAKPTVGQVLKDAELIYTWLTKDI